MQSANFENLLQTITKNTFEMKQTKIDETGHEHMVQKRADHPFLSSFPSQYFPGVINPLKRRTIKQILNIDTRFRDNYATTLATNFNFFLPMMYNSIYTMQLSSIELPITYNLVSEKYGNNYFYIVEGIFDETNAKNNASLLNSLVTITIPDGSYFTNDTLINAINSAISNTVFSGKITFSVGITSPNQEGKCIVTATSSDPTFQFSLIFQTAANQVFQNASLSFCSGTNNNVSNANANPTSGNGFNMGKNLSTQQLPMRLGWLLGFRKGVYTSASSVTVSSEAIIDTRGPNYFYLVVDDFNNNVNNGFFSAFRCSILNKNILARISINTSFSGSVFLAAPNELVQNNLNILTTPREYFGPVNIQSLNVQLVDAYGRIVDLNYMDFSFCLTLTKQYDV